MIHAHNPETHSPPKPVSLSATHPQQSLESQELFCGPPQASQVMVHVIPAEGCWWDGETAKKEGAERNRDRLLFDGAHADAAQTALTGVHTQTHVRACWCTAQVQVQDSSLFMSLHLYNNNDYVLPLSCN